MPPRPRASIDFMRIKPRAARIGISGRPRAQPPPDVDHNSAIAVPLGACTLSVPCLPPRRPTSSESAARAGRAQGSLFDTGSDEDHHKASAITPASKGVCVRQDKDQGVLYMVQRAAVRSDVERAAPRCGTSTEPPAEPRRP